MYSAQIRSSRTFRQKQIPSSAVQRKDGNEAGSWDLGSGHAVVGGRVVSTGLATLSLEVYYRLLPMHGFRNKDAAPAKKIKGGG